MPKHSFENRVDQRSNFSNVVRNFDERRSSDNGVLNFEEHRPSTISCFTNFYVHRPSSIGSFACIDHRASTSLKVVVNEVSRHFKVHKQKQLLVEKHFFKTLMFQCFVCKQKFGQLLSIFVFFKTKVPQKRFCRCFCLYNTQICKVALFWQIFKVDLFWQIFKVDLFWQIFKVDLL